MQDGRLHQLIHDYLDRVSERLIDLPDSERQEILEDLRSHIEESVGDLQAASETEVRNVLDRLGDPEDVAQEARGRMPDARPGPTSGPVYDRSGTPGALEVAAIILTALFWPIGVLLAWISERWKTRDKVIATAVPFVTTMLFVIVAVGGLVVFQTGGSTVSVVSDQVQEAVPAQPSDGEPGTAPAPEPRSPQISEATDSGSPLGRMAAVVGFLVGIVGGPFFSAVFLAIRMQRSTSGASSSGYDEYQQVPARGPV